jgi:hypothetical protein
MHIAALLLSAVIAQATPAPAAAPPTVTTGAADTITTGSAVVNGSVNPNGDATTYHFEYGTGTGYGLTTPDQNLAAGTDAVSVKATISGLTDNTTYHFRLVAGGVNGTDKSFKTLVRASAPSVTSRSATAVTPTTATLNAGINPRSLATTVHFEYGTTASYGIRTAEMAIGAGGATINAAAAIGGLRPNTRYNFRAVATSAAGITRTTNRTFTTGRAPTGLAVTPSTVRPTWGSGLTMTGTVSGSGTTPVALEKLDFPFTGAWTQVASATSNSSGAFTLTAPPLVQTTRFRVVTRTSVVVVSSVTTAFVAVKVGLKKKRLSGRRIRLEGATWPSVPGGRVSLQRQSRSGRWGPVARTNPSPLPGGRSRYRFTVRRASRALNYRVVVVPNDGGAHVRGTSRIITIPRR